MPKAYKPLPPAAELWELFDYKPLTGELVRKSTGTSTKGKTGGHLAVKHAGKMYLSHRLIYAWVTGTDPAHLEIDHINRKRTDNRAWNLRAVPAATNGTNHLGRGYRSRGSKFQAYFCDGYKQRHLGTFDTEAEARAAYLAAKQGVGVSGAE